MKKKQIILLLAAAYILAAALGVLYLSSFPSAVHTVPTAPSEIIAGTETEQEPAIPETDWTETAEDETAAFPEAETESVPASEESSAETAQQKEASAKAQASSVSFVSDIGLNINIRSGPDPAAEIIGKIKPGTGGTVLELTDGEWVYISYEGITGYCARRCLSLEEP